ncbi:hypothetical protein AAVH_22038 [Aphelenchoides avenae]|nr:hypothetical protein AAVH_22038 [Aphelenchus avenae]
MRRARLPIATIYTTFVCIIASAVSIDFVCHSLCVCFVVGFSLACLRRTAWLIRTENARFDVSSRQRIIEEVAVDYSTVGMCRLQSAGVLPTFREQSHLQIVCLFLSKDCCVEGRLHMHTSGLCSLRFGRPSLACKSCRFRKCLAAGTSVTALLSSPPTKAVQTPLDRLVQARKAVYINRHRETSKLCAKLQVHQKRSLSMTTEGCKVALHAELLVVSDFLKHSGFVDLSKSDAKSTCLLLAPPFLYTWVVYEWMLTTIRTFGHNSRRLFFLDERQLDLTEAAVSEYYATDPDVLDPYHVGRLGVPAFLDVLEASRKLARAGLDETESACLALVLFIRSVNYQICNQGVRLQPLLDAVFRN